MPDTKIFITGGAGLVGSHLIEKLAADNNDITALYRSPVPERLQFKNVRWVKGDVLDINDLEDAMKDVEQVYHCAAVVSFNPRHKQAMFDINVKGTANVVNAALLQGVNKMVHVSSVAALGRIRNDVFINEKMNWSEETSNSQYGKTKYLAEMEVWRGIGEGLQAAMVNPSIILGKADWDKGSAGIFKSAYNQFPWYTQGSGGFVDVLDVVEAMVLLMNSDVTAERFILSAENCSYRDVFIMAAKAFGKKPPHKKITPLLASIVWRLEAVKSAINGGDPLVTKETAATAMAAVSFDNSKFLTQFPLFQYHPLEETIKRVCDEITAVL